MKKFIIVMAAMLGMVATAHAQSNWTRAATHYTIYTAGTYATMYFSQSGLPSSNSITSVTVTVNPYPNGNTGETIQICYAHPYSSTYGYCQSQFITGPQTFVYSTQFDGLNARGTFYVRHTLVDGTFPAYPNSVQDIVSVDYQ